MVQTPMRRLLWCTALAVALECAPAGQDPSLSLSAKPSSILDDGEQTTLTATAVDEQGKPGTGAVKFTSVSGSLKDSETITLDADGKAQTVFSCAVRKDPLCKDRVRVVAEWGHLKATVGAEVHIPVGSPLPSVAVDWDDAGSMAPCFQRDAGVNPCYPDGGCQRGFTCVTGTSNQQQCVLKGGNGEVQVTLRFGQPLDLDLHVKEPMRDGGGCEIFYADRGPSNLCGSAGALDLDSNPACQIDNVDTENIIYPANRSAPRGKYIVSVNDYAHCGAPLVSYQVEVRAAGELRYWCSTFGPGDENKTTVITSFVLRNP